jgi:signal transduction histidine kinase
MPSAIAEHLRLHKQEIADAWERAVVDDLKQLASLERAVLLDHLPEVLDALATWIERASSDAEPLFAALADGHALQRLGFGVELAALNIEYGHLRRVIMRELLAVPSSADVREHLIRLDEGLDRAIHLAVQRYTQRRDQLRDRFIGILGHDLRGPLTAATFATHALSGSETLAVSDRKSVQAIARAAERMTRMVSDVLDFARGHLGGGIPTKPVACNMGEICRSAAEEYRIAHPERQISVRTEGDLDGTFDHDRALQCLGNLVGNALQHGLDPIEVAAIETSDRRAVLTRISNRGTIAPELRHKLFDPFVSSSHEGRSSLGLGLYIANEIAQAHGATCNVESSDGQTTFTVRWPRAPRDETPGRP